MRHQWCKRLSSFVKVLVLGYTAGTSWRKDTTSPGMRPAMTLRSWRGRANSLYYGEQPLAVEQTPMFYWCHIWVCHEVDMHKLLHICILPIHPPGRFYPSIHDAKPLLPHLLCNLIILEKTSGPWCGASLCDYQSIPIDPNINLRIMRNQGAWVIKVPGQGLLDMQFTNWQCFSNVKQSLAGGRLQCWRDVISTNTITISPSSLQLTLKQHLRNNTVGQRHFVKQCSQ